MRGEWVSRVGNSAPLNHTCKLQSWLGCSSKKCHFLCTSFILPLGLSEEVRPHGLKGPQWGGRHRAWRSHVLPASETTGPGRAGARGPGCGRRPGVVRTSSLENTDPHSSVPSDQAIPREELTPVVRHEEDEVCANDECGVFRKCLEHGSAPEYSLASRSPEGLKSSFTRRTN